MKGGLRLMQNFNNNNQNPNKQNVKFDSDGDNHLIRNDAAKRKKKSNKKFITEMVLIGVGILISLALIFNGQIRDFMIHQDQQESAQSLTKGAKNGNPRSSNQAKKNKQMNDLRAKYRQAVQNGDANEAKKLAKEIDKKQPKGTTYDWKKVHPLSTTDAVKSRFNKNAAGSIGAVAIPNAGLYLPINAGVGDWAMSVGFGTFSPIQQMGVDNFPIAAHNLSTTGQLGAKLDYVHKGDKVYLTDLNNVYVYEVYHKGIFKPTATWVTNINSNYHGNPVTVLITCHSWGSTREIVFAQMINQYPATKHSLRTFKNLYK